MGRTSFNQLCAEFAVEPRAVCVQFSFLFPQIKSVALNTSKASRVASTIDLAHAKVPQGLWDKGSDIKLWEIKIDNEEGRVVICADESFCVKDSLLLSAASCGRTLHCLAGRLRVPALVRSFGSYGNKEQGVRDLCYYLISFVYEFC